MDTQLSIKHHQLTDIGYYAVFRKRVDDFYSRIRLRIDTDGPADWLGGLTEGEITLAVMQRIALITIHKNEFKKAIAHYQLTGKKIWFPISIQWQAELVDLNLEFNKIICHVLYFLASLGYFLKSIVISLTELNIHRCGVDCRNSSLGNQFFFSGLVPANFPSLDNCEYNLANWLSKLPKPPSKIYHDCKNQKGTFTLNQSTFIFCNRPFKRSALSKNFRLHFRFLKFLICGNRKKSIGFGQRLIISKDLFRALYWDFNAGLDSPVSIFFQSTVLVAKPLWAVAAEKSGIEVVLFHYAIASEPTIGSNPIIQDGIWQLNSWNTAWVVDKQQIAEIALSTAYPPTEYIEMGVPFWGGSAKLQKIRGLHPIVSVFDTNINPDSKFSAGKLDEMGWNNSELEFEFIRIVLQAAEGYSLTIAHKKKRRATDELALFRQQKTNELFEKYPTTYVVIDESVSSDFLISISEMVISKPVSTTAIAAKLMSINSLFLDPTGNIDSKDPSLRNLEIVSTMEELKIIFAKHFKPVTSESSISLRNNLFGPE